LNDAEFLTTYVCVFWCSQIVHIRPYFLNTATAFEFVTECTDVAVFVCLRACAGHNASVLYWPWPGLDSVSYSGCRVVPSVTG